MSAAPRVALSPRDLDLHLNARSSATSLRYHLVEVHGYLKPEFGMAALMDLHRAAHGPASPEPVTYFGDPGGRSSTGTAAAPGLSDRLRKAMDDAHGAGLRLTGYREALDDVSILLAEEVQRLEDELNDGYVSSNDGYVSSLVLGLRRALAIVKTARQ